MTVKITSKKNDIGTTQTDFIRHIRHHSDMGMINNRNTSQFFNHVLMDAHSATDNLKIEDTSFDY